jgi:alkylation response protein AidB-like acyl-CoA dehydrogenase
MHAQYTLPGLQISLSDRSRRAVGALGERLAAALLEKAGYVVSFTQPGQQRGDLVAIQPGTGEMIFVEVKTARRGRDGKWRFTLRKRGCTDHRHADVVILLAVLKSGRPVPFVVPVDTLRHKNHAVITSHPEAYNGRLAVYRQQGAIQL